MKKITVQGIADFMTASEVKRRKIVHNFKHPDRAESQAMIKYYREARDAIIIFHTRGNDINYLRNRISNLYLEALASQGSTRVRLRSNARGLRQYLANFSNKQYTIKARTSSVIINGDVRIVVTPELHVEENGEDKLIKLEFKSKEPKGDYMKIIAQSIFMAQNGQYEPRNCIYMDVPRGSVYKATRATSRLQRNIEAACDSISDIWDSIP